MEDPKLHSKDPVEISRLDLESSTSQEAIITDVKHLASYNWIEAPTPTIAIPGSPAQWSAPNGPRQVKKDRGLVYIAQNAARHPDSPLEPLFRSLCIEQPSFDLNSVDVVTDRNNIRKLLSFVNPSLAKGPLEPFTIRIEMAAHTAIFCRDETKTHEVIGPEDFRGFGHEFEKAYTISQIKDSTGHHRIISYQLGDLRLLVRHETDGFVGDVPTTGDSLVSGLSSLTFSPETTAGGKASTLSKLTIKREGQAVPRETTLEIKTRVIHKPLELEEVAAQLWVSQTPNLVRAYHQRGRFFTPEVEDIAIQVKEWEQAHKNDIIQLIALLHRIVEETESCGGCTTVRYNPPKDKLVIEKAQRRKMLPDDLYALWAKDDGLEQVASQKYSGVSEKGTIDRSEDDAKTKPTNLPHEANHVALVSDSKSES
ncbi:uncharacterized protein N7458_003199 [Penicillium daleae]|uniref:Geranylgeranyl pyrophosphate synthetase n=1 Tax=Penicillium daleae TaxID=63821 RepID=A0AAD6G7W6_9EURO|nr:uncharacterized protein N7458_003199 [Penicillium daleae]KAJ5461647.1 hypothetical protein N7458_003199 [Penicillium daleae]